MGNDRKAAAAELAAFLIAVRDASRRCGDFETARIAASCMEAPRLYLAKS